MIRNHNFKATELVRRRGAKVLSDTFFDQGKNPFFVYSIEEQAIRRDLGHIMFCKRDSRGNTEMPLYVIPEFPGDRYFSTRRPLSVIGYCLDIHSIDGWLEIPNFEVDYVFVNWEDGVNALKDKVAAAPELAKSEIVNRIMAIDAIPKSKMSPEELDRLSHPQTGLRLDISLEP